MNNQDDEAVGLGEREQRWQAAEAAMIRLHQHPDELRDYQAEADLWEATSTDGLDDLPYQHQDEP